MWVFKQLFDDVQAIKPSSSRSVSAEIFLLCLRYRCPTSLDPRLLDPSHVFRQHYGGPGAGEAAQSALSIFHKGFDAQKRQVLQRLQYCIRSSVLRGEKRKSPPPLHVSSHAN